MATPTVLRQVHGLAVTDVYRPDAGGGWHKLSGEELVMGISGL